MSPPADFPPASSLKLYSHEVDAAIPFWAHKNEHSGDLSVHQLVVASLFESDIFCTRTIGEMESCYCDYLEIQYKKPVLPTGAALPDKTQLISKNTARPLEERWANWLGGFEKGSVLYCAFGSQGVLSKDQFQELLLGFELTGMPFFVALKPPVGFETVDEALPEGFKERVQGRGIVHGGWVQQLEILSHSSIGCFVSHAAFSSLLESLVYTDVQLVLMPYLTEQCLNSRLLSGEFKVAVEVEKKETESWFSKESICSSIKTVMDEDSDIGVEIRANCLKLRSRLSNPGIESTYIDNIINKLQEVIA
ncbi:hypothetical protein MKW94_009949 [Papaver nudicaule]|uniref:Uncharacterized protein n=1 Tax=Papaver nudicaule TaxID=74823 RepID=A0AA42ATK0_PAPNU|nr:hypothetical protein [Papaver nudicaule]